MDNKSYTPEQRKLIVAVRKIEQMTRHKAVMPPTIPRKDIENMGLVE